MTRLIDLAVILDAASLTLRLAEEQAVRDEREVTRLRLALGDAEREIARLKLPASPPSAISTFEGFGRLVTGGAGKPEYRVKTLKDGGPGSLRDALTKGDRSIVFDIGGDLVLTRELAALFPNVTIDALTAPAPGITLRGAALSIRTGNVIVRGIRHRGAPVGMDGIAVYKGSGVVLDHCSVSGYGDGGIDITRDSVDVSMQWCIVGPGGVPLHSFPCLVSYDAYRVSVHHNLFYGGAYRNPLVSRGDGSTALPVEIVGDVRNNLVWEFEGFGTSVGTFGTANILNNYYSTSKNVEVGKVIEIRPAEGGVAYVAGNVSAQHGLEINVGNRRMPFACIEPTTHDALAAALLVLAQAGARGPNFGLDAVDLAYLGQIKVP